MLELGNCTLDRLKNLLNLPPSHVFVPPISVVDGQKMPSVTLVDAIRSVRGCAEGLLVYAVTQLAMWLCKQQMDSGYGMDMDGEETYNLSDSATSQGPRAPIPLGDHLRRGMTGEMAADLQSLLNKAKPLISKSDPFIGKDTVDLTSILIAFLQDVVIAPAQ
jgi:nuclear pore complex protein Nup188